MFFHLWPLGGPKWAKFYQKSTKIPNFAKLWQNQSNIPILALPKVKHPRTLTIVCAVGEMMYVFCNRPPFFPKFGQKLVKFDQIWWKLTIFDQNGSKWVFPWHFQFFLFLNSFLPLFSILLNLTKVVHTDILIWCHGVVQTPIHPLPYQKSQQLESKIPVLGPCPVSDLQTPKNCSLWALWDPPF